jgi:hypothetical protein
MTSSSLPKVAIQDANILIDMIDIDVLALMLDLPMGFHSVHPQNRGVEVGHARRGTRINGISDRSTQKQSPPPV